MGADPVERNPTLTHQESLSRADQEDGHISATLFVVATGVRVAGRNRQHHNGWNTRVTSAHDFVCDTAFTPSSVQLVPAVELPPADLWMSASAF
jgi:hypothetical protein